jgi:peptidoglycan/LPS O-acetylase OafA/YrhL
MAATVGPAEDLRPDTAPGPGFRRDIQGLRALAVLLVLAYHAGVPAFAGGFVGVDVFFVISGYLITGLLLREIERSGTFRLGTFYARRARRLLPATAVVLVASAAITVATIPVTRWSTIAGDIVASTLYVTNWRLAAQSVDYLAADGAGSPVQHFWTLAVEEQFYIVWPVLILVLLWLHRRTGWSRRGLLLGGIGVLGVGSFAWSVHLTAAAPGPAYVVTTTRVWELAIGALLAFGASRRPFRSDRAAEALTVVGLAAITVAAVTYGSQTPFPGSAAALPTLGTAAVIAAGTGRPALRVGRLLTGRSAQFVGGLSYSLYLWHWPLLVGAREQFGVPGEPLSALVGSLVVASAVVPAWFTFRYVEAPLHHASWLAARAGRATLVAGAATVLGLGAAAAVATLLPATQPVPVDRATPVAGAAAIDDLGGAGAASDVVVDESDFTPDPIAALEDVARLAGQRCIQPLDGDELDPCVHGPAEAETVVAVVGDSKMHQWLPAIERIADARGWRVITYLKSGCPLVGVPTARDGALNRPCRDHNEARFRALAEGPSFDLVLTSQRASEAFLPDAPGEARRAAMVEDLRRTWGELASRGAKVGVVVDNDEPPMAVPDCVAQNRGQLSACAFPRGRAAGVRAAAAQLEALTDLDGVHAIDLRDRICPGEVCPAVLGDVLVYRQSSHLTATYVGTLTDALDQAIDEVMDAP